MNFSRQRLCLNHTNRASNQTWFNDVIRSVEIRRKWLRRIEFKQSSQVDSHGMPRTQATHVMDLSFALDRKITCAAHASTLSIRLSYARYVPKL